MVDEDAPDCAESVRFWCFTHGSYSEKERMSISGTANVAVRSTPEVVGALASAPALPTASGAGGPVAGGLSLASLVNVANQAQESAAAEPTGSRKGKGVKKDKKDKKVKKELPEGIKEKKDAVRIYRFA